jgi:hypothetical protein
VIEIRVVGRDPDQVAAWVKQIVALVSSQTEFQVYQSHVRPGREGDHLAYINFRPPQPEVAATRIARKSPRLLGRRWRNRRS